MIHGLNFNGTQIPPERAKKFPKTYTLRLQGVCDTIEEAKAMHVQASNGHRNIVIDKRNNLYAVYCD
jgi:hypothetical protein